MAEATSRRRSWHRMIPLVVALVGLALIGVATARWISSNRSAEATPAAAGSVVLDRIPSPEQLQRMHVVKADDRTRLRIRSVGLDVPVGVLSSVDGEITPPTVDSAYLVRDYGGTLDEADRKPLLVVMHSVHGAGFGPGNALIDVAGQRSAVEPGTSIVLGDRRYRVTSSAVVAKADLPHRSEVWQAPAGELVIITCMITPQRDQSSDNLVVIARRVKQ